MTPLYEYDLYYPASATATAEDQLVTLKRTLTEFFGGLTDFRHRSAGEWKIGAVTFHDDVVLLRVLHADRDAARACLQRIKGDLERDLSQEQILIIEREVAQLD
jgi:hypothetical protein